MKSHITESAGEGVSKRFRSGNINNSLLRDQDKITISGVEVRRDDGKSGVSVGSVRG